MAFSRVSIDEARRLISAGDCRVLDIRDEQSYAQDHIPGAIHLDNSKLQEIVENTEAEQPVLIYCYHGMSSQSAAAWFTEQGFAKVFSLDGGFEAWRGDS